MTNNGIVNIHGKDYMTVARRVELAHEKKDLEGIKTEVLNHNPIVVKAEVTIKGQVYTGVSSVSPDSTKIIERMNPYEVAETSAVGRALGFAGYGLLESIASADEMVRATATRRVHADAEQKEVKDQRVLSCVLCGKDAYEKEGTTKSGKPYHGIFCSTGDKAHTQWL